MGVNKPRQTSGEKSHLKFSFFQSTVLRISPKNRWDLPKNNVGEFQIPFIPNADKKCYDALRRWQRKLVIREHSSLIADAD